jgi:hypothetical protein
VSIESWERIMVGSCLIVLYPETRVVCSSVSVWITRRWMDRTHDSSSSFTGSTALCLPFIFEFTRSATDTVTLAFFTFADCLSQSVIVREEDMANVP